MKNEQRYQATKQFKYKGKTYQPGDEWVPDGGLFDDEMIEQGRFVVPVKDRALERAKKVLYAQQAYKKPPTPVEKFSVLAAAGFDTFQKIREASDEELLAVKGIGKATLAKIRQEVTDG